MNRRNYARELSRIIEKNGSRRPKVLLHACCGPCSTSVLEYLSNYFDITVFWYNPNIYPEEEFNKRCSTLEEVIDKMNLSESIKLINCDWRHEEYLAAAKGFENEKEGGKRCEECFKCRLFKTAEIAKENGFDYFCTTLSVSRHKNAIIINTIGEEAAEKTGIKWLPSDFKKHDGENRSVELSEKLKIYRQVYCGCEFSLAARQNNKE